MRRTVQTLAVLDALTREDDWTYGYELMQETGLKAGTIYPILERLVANKLVKQEYERNDRKVRGRPPRIYYRITNKGRTQAAIWRAEE